jgi:hypothetical protein
MIEVDIAEYRKSRGYDTPKHKTQWNNIGKLYLTKQRNTIL